MIPELPADAVLAVNADDPLVGSLAAGHAQGVTFGVDDPAQARPDLQHAADSKYCVRCGTPYDYTAAYVGHLGDYLCPACGHSRPALDVAARRIELHGTDGAAFDLVTPEGTRRVEMRFIEVTTGITGEADIEVTSGVHAGMEIVRDQVEY